MVENNRQWKGKTGGGKFGQKSLFFMLRVINVYFFYPVLFLVIPFYMLFARNGYISIMRYFKDSYNMSSWKAFWQTFRNHFVFGQVVLDKFAVISGNKTNFKIKVTGKQYIEELVKENKGFIIASSHIGNFEAGGFIFQQHNRHVNALIYGGETTEMQQQRINAMKKANINAISVNEDMSHLFTIKQILEDGEILTIPCDRVHGSPKKIKCNFLGRDAYFPLGPFRLAAQMDVPVVTLFMMKDNFRKYHAYIMPVQVLENETNIAKRANLLAENFVRSCEEILRKYPHQWFNFYDFWNIN